MKRSAAIALALATALLGSFAACAQAEQPTVYHHSHVHRYDGPHHTLHHRLVARDRAPVAERPDSQPPRTNQMFQPYAAPGDGDDNGLSRDPDDCMKGCIGGNPG